jgi:hypothetical protein
MSDLMLRGPILGSTGSPVPLTASTTGAQRVTDAHAAYLEAAVRGNIYFMSVAAGAPTAYVGAAGGTPLIGIHNGTGSGKVANLLFAAAAARIVSSGIGHTDIALWAGASVTPTGTTTQPRQSASFAQGGEILGFSNTAMTGSTALNLALPLASYFWGTSVGVSTSPAIMDLRGLIVLKEGMQAALGATVALASVTWDVALWWELVPYLP